MSITESVAVDQELVEVLLKALEKAREPLTAEKVRKDLPSPYKRPLKMIAEQLNELVQGGKAFQFGPSGRSKQPRFWSRSEAHYAEHVILGLVANAPMKWSDVEKKAKSSLKGFPSRQWNELRREMLESGKLFEVPPLMGGKAVLLSSEPINLSVYVRDALSKATGRSRSTRD